MSEGQAVFLLFRFIFSYEIIALIGRVTVWLEEEGLGAFAVMPSFVLADTLLIFIVCSWETISYKRSSGNGHTRGICRKVQICR